MPKLIPEIVQGFLCCGMMILLVRTESYKEKMMKVFMLNKKKDVIVLNPKNDKERLASLMAVAETYLSDSDCQINSHIAELASQILRPGSIKMPARTPSIDLQDRDKNGISVKSRQSFLNTKNKFDNGYLTFKCNTKCDQLDYWLIQPGVAILVGTIMGEDVDKHLKHTSPNIKGEYRIGMTKFFESKHMQQAQELMDELQKKRFSEFTISNSLKDHDIELIE